MAILSPSGLETISYRQQGWNYILTSNMQLLNTQLTKLRGPVTATSALGAPIVADAAALTQTALTNSSGGTVTTTIVPVTSNAISNNNFSSIAAELELARADIIALRGTVNALLSALRITGGCGVLND